MFEIKYRSKDKNGDPETLNTSLVFDFDLLYPPSNDDDVAIIKVNQMSMISAPNIGGKTYINYYVTTSTFATKSDFDNNTYLPSDRLYFTGYPEWYDRNIRLILREGSIASDPKYNYHYPPKIVGNCIAFEAFFIQRLFR